MKLLEMERIDGLKRRLGMALMSMFESVYGWNSVPTRSAMR